MESLTEYLAARGIDSVEPGAFCRLSVYIAGRVQKRAEEEGEDQNIGNPLELEEFSNVIDFAATG